MFSEDLFLSSLTESEANSGPTDSLTKRIRSMLKKDVRPEDSISQTGTSVSGASTTSARARAAARKAGLQARVAFMQKQQELEYKQLEQEFSKKERMLKLEMELERERWEMDQNLRQLEIQAELEAANAEEAALANFGPKRVTHDVTQPVTRIVMETPTSTPEESAQACSSDKKVSHPTPLQHGMEVPQESVTQATLKSLVASQQIQRQLLDVIGLPKTTLMTFDGDPLKYWSFINSFDSCVGNSTVDDGAKLNRLMEYCTGKAAKVIQHCCLMRSNEGYRKARQLLKERFGNPYRISEAWIKKVTDGPPVRPNCSDALQMLADDVLGCIEVLKAMDKLEDIDTRSGMLKILSRLPTFLQSRWRKTAVQNLDRTGSYPNIAGLAVFLQQVAREMNDPVFGVLEEKSPRGSHPKPNTRSKGLSFQVEATTNSSGNDQEATVKKDTKAKKPPDDQRRTSDQVQKCYLCSGNHALKNCREFMTITPVKRLELVKEKRLCFNCLETKNHSARSCGKQSECNMSGCTWKHSKLLHEALVSRQNNSDSNKRDQESPRETRGTVAHSLVCHDVPKAAPKVALPIVAVWVRNPDQDTYLCTKALLDTGSNRSFCSLALANKLGLTGKQTTLSLETLDADRITKADEISLEISGTGRSKRHGMIKLPRVFALENFPSLARSSAEPVDAQRWAHTRDLILPSCDNMEEAEVNLIIGQDTPAALIPLEVRYGGQNEPYATRTVLGWTLNGPLYDVDNPEEAISNFVLEKSSSDTFLETQVERFWKLDSPPGTSNGSPMSVEDKRVIQVWDETTTKENGHYTMDIPFKESSTDLPNNKPMAERRLQSLGRRLSRKPELHKLYTAEMDKMIQKGYAEQVAEDNTSGTPGRTWYIPHHNVVNPKKPDKFRIVYDCAAQYGETSLNKMVSQGPDLTNKLLGVLLRFRENRIALMADIEAMFLQVRVSPHHRDALRFLWWVDGDLSQDPEIYRMCSHLFGGVWSPSCAAYALRRTAEDNRSSFPPDVIEAVLDNFYVDDCLMSVEDEKSALRLQDQLCLLLRSGGFRLTKWLSNSRVVLEAIPKDEVAKQLKLLDLDLGTSLPVDRALGVHWNAETDVLGLQIKEQQEFACTKRGVLSLMSSVYDPLGFVGPCILLAKKIFQAECRLDKSWDDPLEEKNEQRWRKWVCQLHKLRDLQIQRCIVPEPFVKSPHIELHHFCDASQEAYGVVSYVRLTNENGTHCSFLMAKTRLAPIKQLTVPRLELLGAVVAVQMNTLLHREMKLTIEETVFWTDSMIVLQYIRNKTKRFHTFVANRIAFIHEGSDPSQWRHVDSQNNPADMASRGLEADEMVRCLQWSKGPAFLWEERAKWPVSPDVKRDLLRDDKEVKQEVTSFATEVEDTSLFEDLLCRYAGIA